MSGSGRGRQGRWTSLGVFLLSTTLTFAANANNLLETVPETRNSPLIVTPNAVKADGFSGGNGYSYEFRVPPGTGGLTPSLVLSYSSLDKASEYGWGWSLNLSAIERSTRLGPPAYTDPVVTSGGDQFELDGELLVGDPVEAGRYHKERIQFQKIIYSAATDSWTVFGKDGSQMRYGSRADLGANSRLRTSPTSTDTFRWVLDEVVDPLGNSYRIEYEEELDEDPAYSTYVVNIHPRRIRYSFHASPGPKQSHRLIELRWGPRANVDGSGQPIEDEDRPTSLRSGFKIQRTRRLVSVLTGLSADDTIDATEQIDRYELAYAPKTGLGSLQEEAPFSKLVSIQRYGSDDNPFETATTFEYSRPARGWGEHVPVTFFGSDEDKAFMGGQLEKPAYTNDAVGGLFDMNGDGLLDRVRARKSGGLATWRVALALPPHHPSAPGFDAPIIWRWCDAGAVCSDTAPSAMDERIREVFANGPQLPRNEVVRRDLIDLNGDSLLDYVVSDDANSDWTVYLSNGCSATGCSFGPPVPWSRPQLAETWPRYIGCDYVTSSEVRKARSLIVDVDGDGFPDHLAVDTSGQLLVSWNLARVGTMGFSVFQPISGGFDTPYLSDRLSRGVLDFNADGLPDLAAQIQSGGQPCLSFGHSTGTGFPEMQSGQVFPRGALHCGSSDFAFLREELVGRYEIEVNGDGVIDRAVFKIVGSPSLEIYYDVYLGLGDGTYAQVPVKWNQSFDGGYGFRMAIDLNGDHLTDDVRETSGCANCPDYAWTVAMHPGRPGLLTEVRSESSAVTTIEYGSSALAVGVSATSASRPYSAESLPPSAVPQTTHFDVPIELRVSSGGSSPDQVRTYSYAEPRFDYLRRENLGFRMAEEVVVSSLPVMTRTLYHQSTAKLSKMELEETLTDWDSEPVVHQSREVIWDEVEPQTSGGTPIPAVFAVPSVETAKLWAYPTDLPNPVPADRISQSRLAQRFFDPKTGNLLAEVDLGDPGDGSDDVITNRTYRTEQEMDGEWMVSYVATDSVSYAVAPETFVGGTQVESIYLQDGTGRLDRRETIVRNEIGEPNQTRVERYTIDEYGNPTARWAPNYSSEYPSTANATTATYEGDYHTFLATFSNPKQHVSHWAWDPRRGEVDRSLDARQYLRCWDYDEFGRLAATLDASASVPPAQFGVAVCDTTRSSFEFEDLGDASLQRVSTKSYVEPTEFLETFQYFDGLGRVYREAQAAEAGGHFITHREWDERGNPVCESLPRAAQPADPWTCATSQTPVRVSTFDPLAREIERRLMPVDRLETTTDYTLEPVPNLEPSLVEDVTIQGVPDLHRRTRLDVRGNTVEIDESPTGGVTIIRRDALGRPTLFDGPDIDVGEPGVSTGPHDANLLFIAYNSVDQQLRVANPPALGDGSNAALLSVPHWKYQYDLSGNLKGSISAASSIVCYAYDELNRITVVDNFPCDPYSSISDDDVRYIYDADLYSTGLMSSELTGMPSQYKFKRTFNYDVRGRKAVTQHFSPGLVSPAYAFSVYDLQDRMIAQAYPGSSYSTGVRVGWKYDGALLSEVHELTNGEFFGAIMSHVVDGTPLIDQMTHHPNGELSSMRTLSGGAVKTVTSYTFDPDDYRPATFDVSGPGGLLLQLGYDFDEAGNLQSVVDTFQTRSGTFTYDGLHRLATANFPSWTPGEQSYVYEYNTAGSLTRKGSSRIRYGGGVNDPHAATCIADVNPSGPEPCHTTFTYDRDGNRTARLTAGVLRATYTWTMSGKLSNISEVFTGRQSIYGYDGAGLRAVRATYNPSVPGEQQSDVVAGESFEIDLTRGRASNHIMGAGRRLATIVRTGASSALPEGTASTYLYHHADRLGSNLLVTDETGTVVQDTILKPYGETYAELAASGPIDPWNRPSGDLFTDHRLDPETGFYEMQARYYDPAVGGFLSADPVLVTQNTFNSHGYAGSNPMRYIDPDGRYFHEGDLFDGSDITVLCGYPEFQWDEFGDSIPINPFNTPVAMAEPVPAQEGSGFWSTVGRVAGAIWNLPNTALGVAFGLVGIPTGGFGFEHGQLQFKGNLLQRGLGWVFTAGGNGAITLGDAGVYPTDFGPDTVMKVFDGQEITLGFEESLHSAQGRILGPLYLPANIVGGLAGLISSGNWHGSANFMERGPHAAPPRVF